VQWKQVDWTLHFEVDRSGVVGGSHGVTGEKYKKHCAGGVLSTVLDLSINIDNGQVNSYKGIIHGDEAELLITIEKQAPGYDEGPGCWRCCQGTVWMDLQHPQKKQEKIRRDGKPTKKESGFFKKSSSVASTRKLNPK